MNDDPLTGALARMADLQADIAKAPPGHSSLACDALGQAEADIFQAAGQAGEALGWVVDVEDPEAFEETYRVAGSLLWAVRDLWTAHTTVGVGA